MECLLPLVVKFAAGVIGGNAAGTEEMFARYAG